MATQLTPLVMDQATVLTVTDTDLVAANAAGSWAYITDPHRTFLWVENGAGAPITVTIVTKDTGSHGASATTTPAVINAEKGFIGPFQEWQLDTSGRADWSYSAVVNIEVAVVKCGS